MTVAAYHWWPRRGSGSPRGATVCERNIVIVSGRLFLAQAAASSREYRHSCSPHPPSGNSPVLSASPCRSPTTQSPLKRRDESGTGERRNIVTHRRMKHAALAVADRHQHRLIMSCAFICWIRISRGENRHVFARSPQIRVQFIARMHPNSREPLHDRMIEADESSPETGCERRAIPRRPAGDPKSIGRL